MSKIKVLFENNQFGLTRFKNENYQFPEEVALKNGVQLHCGMEALSFTENKSYKKNAFKSHPRNFEEDSEKSDEDSDGSDQSQYKKVEFGPELRAINYSPTSELPTSNENQESARTKLTPKFEEFKSDMSEAKTEDSFCSKQSAMFGKTNTLLKEIWTIMRSGGNTIEGLSDYLRRDRITKEFMSRFSRQYTYQVGRRITAIRKCIKAQAVPTKDSLSHYIALNQQLLSIHQLIMQALQAYSNFIPTSLPTRDDTKFKEILKNITDICKLTKTLRKHNNVNSSCTVIDEVEKNCRDFAQTVNDTLARMLSPKMKEKPSKPKSSRTTGNAEKVCSTPFYKKESLASRLSMYNTPQTKYQKGANGWRKPSTLLPKRCNVASRYRMINDKKDGIDQKKSLECFKPNKLAESKSSILHKNPNEDNIVTMVEVDAKRQQEIKNKSLITSQNEVKSKIQPLLQKLMNEINNKDGLVDQSACNDALDNLKGLLNQMQQITEFSNTEESSTNMIVSKPQPDTTTDRAKKVQDNKSNVNVIDTTSCTVTGSITGPVIDPMTSVSTGAVTGAVTKSITGPKNAKLICIKDKSCFKPEKTSANAIKLEVHREHIVDEFPKIDNLRNEKKPNGLIKCELPLLKPLPKNVAINIVQYKLTFHKFTKPNHMYRKTMNVQPWILTSKISDNLVEHILLSVLQEMEFHKIATKIYRSEFE